MTPPRSHQWPIIVRRLSGLGPCMLLGELVSQTTTRYVYRSQFGYQTWVPRDSSLVHLKPCPACRDHRSER
jgi:hypothetical protein